MNELRTLVCVIPARDEAARVGEVVLALRGLRPPLEALGLRALVLVVDDGSRDETARVAREAGADRILTLSPGRGLGGSPRGSPRPSPPPGPPP